MNEEKKFKYFIDHIRNGSKAIVKNILKDKKFNPIEKDNAAIKLAVITKNYEILKLLLDNFDVQTTVDYEQLLNYSKDEKITKLIRESIPPNSMYAHLRLQNEDEKSFKEFLYYVEYGNIEQVKRILKEGKVNPSAQDNKAIKMSAEIGHTELSKILLDDYRIADTVDYTDIVQIASDNSNKKIVKIIEDAFERDKIRKKGQIIINRKSPIEFKTVRKVITKSDLLPVIEFVDFKKDLDNTKIEGFEINDLKKSFGYEFEPTITVIPKSEEISENKEYRTFLCDLEMFNWVSRHVSEDHNSHRLRNDVSFETIYSQYTMYLGRMLGSDITIFTMNTIDKENSKKLNNISNLGIKSIVPDFSKSINRMFNFPQIFEFAPQNLKGFFGNVSDYYRPLFIREYESEGKFLYVCNYSDLILKRDEIRYSFINTTYLYSHGGLHYTFIFVDHNNKIVEYYDPHIDGNRKEAILFTYKLLQSIFEDYKINDFWRLSSIQKTEEYEKDEVGFCVKWGHMMMHLKMLNIGMSINEIEERFISECESKNLSLYEIVLNYTYFMRRIIHQIPSNLIKLRNLLKSEVFHHNN